jgi:hypothetical protein
VARGVPGGYRIWTSRLYLGDELDLRQLLGNAGLAVPTTALATREVPVCKRFPALGLRPPMPAASSRPGLAT